MPSPERGRGRPVVGVIGSSLPCTRSANIPASLESALMKQETSLVLLNLGSLVHAFLALCVMALVVTLCCVLCAVGVLAERCWVAGWIKRSYQASTGRPGSGAWQACP